MNKNKKLIYITYQYFPAETANTQQTMSMIKNFIRNQLEVKLVFPDRGNKKFTKDEILNFYDIDNNLEIESTKHYLPFGRFNFLNSIFFSLSHFIWAYAVTKRYKKISENIFFTRSDWIFYFLSKQKQNVIFECHQYSKIRKFVIEKCQSNPSSLIIFTNQRLMNEFDIGKKFKQNTIVLPNGFDSELFENHKGIKSNKVVFVGNLIRFDQSRGIDFLINSFEEQRLNDIELLIIGGPEDQKRYLEKNVLSNVTKNINFMGYLKKKDAINEMKDARVGILLNQDDTHSKFHTSPLKYFEYLASGLNVLAVDYPSHRDLPFSENIIFFEKDNTEDFINKLFQALKTTPFDKNIDNFSFDSRALKIINFFARLEGVEPPTL